MAKNKKDLPVDVLKSLTKFYEVQGENFQRVSPKEGELLRYIDKDPTSEFYFVIKSYKYGDKGLKFVIERKPNSTRSVNLTIREVLLKDLEIELFNWINIIDTYSQLQSPYDDPIVDAYAKEAIQDYFQIIDDDADTNPYDIKRVLLLDEYLASIEEGIDEFQNNSNEEDVKKVKELAEEIRANLTTKTKRWVVHRFSVLYGRIAKVGIPAIKKLIEFGWKEAAKELIKNAVKKTIENPGKLKEIGEAVKDMLQ